jgi:hypothetical protein
MVKYLIENGGNGLNEIFWAKISLGLTPRHRLQQMASISTSSPPKNGSLALLFTRARKSSLFLQTSYHALLSLCAFSTNISFAAKNSAAVIVPSETSMRDKKSRCEANICGKCAQ